MQWLMRVAHEVHGELQSPELLLTSGAPQFIAYTRELIDNAISQFGMLLRTFGGRLVTSVQPRNVDEMPIVGPVLLRPVVPDFVRPG